jgi:serine/threonine protein kinase
MGAVYRAYDLSLDRWVAIKVLLPEHATEAAERRFLREARILARLQHSHIVPIHQVHQKDGLSFFVMDFIEGVTLAHALRDRSFNLKRTRALGKELLTAVQAVHGQGIVHCDIKPSNIFLAEGHMCLGDFGIATPPIDSDATETQRGIVGTPMYMAPEQSAGREPVPQTDLYAVGLVLYEAFQGRPWPAATDPRTVTGRASPSVFGACSGVPYSSGRKTDGLPPPISFARSKTGARRESPLPRLRWVLEHWLWLDTSKSLRGRLGNTSFRSRRGWVPTLSTIPWPAWSPVCCTKRWALASTSGFAGLLTHATRQP